MNDISETVSAGQLRAFVERIERIEADIKDLNSDKSEIYKELRGVGFDVKAVRQCVAARKLDTAEREERTAIFDLYWSALNGPVVHVHTRVENIEKFASKEASETMGGLPVAAASETAEETGRTPAYTRMGRDGTPHRSGVTGGESAATISNPAPDSSPVADKAGEVAHTASPAEDFTPPAFLVVKAAKQLRPHCLDRENCAGYGSHTCHRCTVAATGQNGVAA